MGSLRAAEHIARRSKRQVRDSRMDVQPPLVPAGDAAAILMKLQADMTRHAAFQRDAAGMRGMLEENARHLSRLMLPDLRDPQLVARLRLRDLLLTQREVLSAMLHAIEHDPAEGVLTTRSGVSERVPARPLPARELWFERAWHRYREEISR